MFWEVIFFFSWVLNLAKFNIYAFIEKLLLLKNLNRTKFEKKFFFYCGFAEFFFFIITDFYVYDKYYRRNVI